MKIKYLGGSSFLLDFDKKEILINPSENSKTDVCVITHESESISSQVEANKILDWPGEYETNEVLIEAFEFFREPKDAEKKLGKTLIFTFDFNNQRICHLGAIGCKLTPEIIDKIGGVDVLIVPIGGENTIDTKKAKEVISSIDPKVAIPMNYGGNLASFLKEMGAEGKESIEEIDTKKIKSTEDKIEIVVLDESL